MHRVEVRDLHSGRSFHFLCDRRLTGAKRVDLQFHLTPASRAKRRVRFSVAACGASFPEGETSFFRRASCCRSLPITRC